MSSCLFIFYEIMSWKWVCWQSDPTSRTRPCNIARLQCESNIQTRLAHTASPCEDISFFFTPYIKLFDRSDLD